MSIFHMKGGNTMTEVEGVQEIFSVFFDCIILSTNGQIFLS